ncbi:MAG: hypothetical protein WBB76_06850, partial [Gaiellaceae bacterium]
WPVTEVVKQLDPGEAVGTALASILGDDSAGSSPDEIAWAFRKLLESRAAEQPLVVVFDDVHWGEPAFLDLVEHVGDLSRGAPILLLCMARPELLDQRPTWGGGKLNATNVLLEPLAPEETGQLIAALDEQLEPELRARILEAAGGNPLFVEEMVAMIAEDGSADVTVPPTIQALLAARLDQLDTAERDVLERGAVEGLVFHRGAVVALAPDEGQVDGRLIALVRKDLVRPEQTVLADDEAYRFRHLLIRDTAYEALPKAVRAELHERFAVWLEEHGADLVELDELVGYHLEQAYGYRVELGPVDDIAAGIGERAAGKLLRSAERAEERGDTFAARGLLSRALELMSPDSLSYRPAQLYLAVALAELGEFPAAAVLRKEVAAAASAAQDDRLLARSELARVEAEIQSDPTSTMRDALATTKEALAVLERLGDEEGAVWALRFLANITGWLGNGEEMMRLLDQALERAERVSPRLASEVLIWMAFGVWWSFTPTDEGIRLCDGLIARSSSKRVEGTATMIRGVLKATRGLLDEGRRDVADGRELLRELGASIWWAGTAMAQGDMELVAGDPAIAYEVLAVGQEALGRSAETGYLATIVGLRAQAALALGRETEALELADETERLAQRDDFDPHVRERLVRACVAARRGFIEQADRLIGEATAILEPTDYEMLHRDLAFAQAEVEGLAGRPDGERQALERALAHAERKADLVSAQRARQRLAEL